MRIQYFPFIFKYFITKLKYKFNKDKICKLCLKKKKLVRVSHIIPKFLYKEIVGKNEKLFKLKPYDLKENKNKFNKTATGEYDQWILCKECEILISNYESYGDVVLFTGTTNSIKKIKLTNYVTEKGMKFYQLSELDYKRFKLFLLSILWKTSISKREFASEIKLGINEEILRLMLLQGNPKNESDYPVLILTFLQHKSIPSGVVAQPSMVRVKGYNVCRFLINGFWFNFIISVNVKDNYILQSTVNLKGECKVHQMDEKSALDFLLNYFGM